MRLIGLSINNYKSLKNVDFSPKNLSILVGPNAAGKSNFIDALDFLASIYRYGIENAISMKGGYENIAFRKHRRTKAPISFEVRFMLSRTELNRLYARVMQLKNIKRLPPQDSSLTIVHSFSFKTKGSDIRSDFIIIDEKLEIKRKPSKNNTSRSSIFLISRNHKGVIEPTYLENEIVSYYFRSRFDTDLPLRDFLLSSEQSLFISHPVFFYALSLEKLSNIGTFRFSSHACKQSGVPAPQPFLSLYGDNLPAVLDWFKRKHKEQWGHILEPMIDILPDLEDITIDYTHTKRLGIYFKTKNLQRPWSVEEVSDGTLQALAILTASVDPRFLIIAIEEVENSLHPWIISILMDRLRLISKNKLVIITTHSPIVIDKSNPDELWIVFKVDGETNIKSLPCLEKNILNEWENGAYKLSSYLDGGLLPQAVPGGML